MKTHFSQDWKNWIAENVNAGQDLDGIFKILIDEGYSYDIIVKEMNYQPSKAITELVNPFKAKALAQQKQRIASINNNGARISQQQIVLPQAQAFDSDEIDLRTIDRFLSPEECSKIIALIKSRLRPSEVSNSAVNALHRNSRTCDLGRLNNAFIESIDLRICQLIGIHRAYSELLEGQFYELGQEFKAHTDYFEKNEFMSNCQEFGQRTYTVMIYLNEVEKGGETSFSKVGASFKPKAGTAVIWNNLNADGTPNSKTVHQSKPVEQGDKAIITKWFRSKPASGYEYLDMLTKNVNKFD